MTVLPVSALPRASATIRSLSGYERLFLAVDIVNGFNFAIAVTFSGVIAHSRWQAAFAQLQKRHPLLNASVNVDDWHAPTFEHGAGDSIPLRFLRRSSATDWQRAMESEIAKPFDLSSAPLLRATIVEDDTGCDLVVTANHVIADGIAILALVDELLRALAGHKLEELPPPPSAEERVAAIVASESGLALDAAAIDEFTPAPTPRAFASRNRKGRNTISALRLSPAQSALLLERARKNQTTVSAVLLAALAIAVRGVSPDQCGSDLQWSTPVNARPYLGNEGDLAISVISARGIDPHSGDDLFAAARAVKSNIARFQNFRAIQATYTRVDAVYAQKLDAATLVKAVVSIAGHDLMLSNLKTAEFPVEPDDLRVESVWGPSVLLGVEGEQMIGSVTFGGALHLLYSSFTPLPGLLEAVSETIESACCAS
jgi:hypothetical protein